MKKERKQAHLLRPATFTANPPWRDWKGYLFKTGCYATGKVDITLFRSDGNFQEFTDLLWRESIEAIVHCNKEGRAYGILMWITVTNVYSRLVIWARSSQRRPFKKGSS